MRKATKEEMIVGLVTSRLCIAADRSNTSEKAENIWTLGVKGVKGVEVHVSLVLVFSWQGSSVASLSSILPQAMIAQCAADSPKNVETAMPYFLVLDMHEYSLLKH